MAEGGAEEDMWADLPANTNPQMVPAGLMDDTDDDFEEYHGNVNFYFKSQKKAKKPNDLTTFLDNRTVCTVPSNQVVVQNSFNGVIKCGTQEFKLGYWLKIGSNNIGLIFGLRKGLKTLITIKGPKEDRDSVVRAMKRKVPELEVLQSVDGESTDQGYCSLCFHTDHTISWCQNCKFCYNPGHYVDQCPEFDKTVDKSDDETGSKPGPGSRTRKLHRKLKRYGIDHTMAYYKHIIIASVLPEWKTPMTFAMDIEKGSGVHLGRNFNFALQVVVVAHYGKGLGIQTVFHTYITRPTKLVTTCQPISGVSVTECENPNLSMPLSEVKQHLIGLFTHNRLIMHSKDGDFRSLMIMEPELNCEVIDLTDSYGVKKLRDMVYANFNTRIQEYNEKESHSCETDARCTLKLFNHLYQDENPIIKFDAITDKVRKDLGDLINIKSKY